MSDKMWIVDPWSPSLVREVTVVYDDRPTLTLTVRDGERTLTVGYDICFPSRAAAVSAAKEVITRHKAFAESTYTRQKARLESELSLLRSAMHDEMQKWDDVLEKVR